MWFNTYSGELAALCTAMFWTVSAIAFESASLKVGSLSVNIIRMFLGFTFLTIFTSIRRGIVLPVDASGEAWLWLSLSGLIGFVLGDLFLFKSYTIIGSRFAMLIMTLVPPITALLSRIILSEKLTLFSYLGMTLTFFGISMAIFGKHDKNDKLVLKLSPKGLFFAFLGALGQGLGLVLSKLGMKDYNPFAATQIRAISGIAGFVILVTLMRRWDNVFKSLSNKSGMRNITLGSFFGPFLGVSFSLIAVQLTKAGIASTIMAIVPVLIIPPAYFIHKQKITFIEIVGSIISVGGVALFFIK